MVSIQDLAFRYPKSEFELKIDHFEVAPGEKIAIVGPSGSGKTTLLNLISGISLFQDGSINVLDTDLKYLADSQRRDFRISRIGMVFQQFELVEYLDARDNILLPFYVNRSLEGKKAAQQTCADLADRMGMGDKLRRFPAQLSQGEQQRVAICRALVTRPQLVLADEPTGNLDPANKIKILNLMFEACDAFQQTLIVVTHDMNILDGFDRVVDFEKFRHTVEAN